LCLAQGEEVDSELGAGVGVRGAGLVVVDAVGVEVVVGMGERTIGVGVGGGGVGMGMMKKTILKATIRLRTQKAIWRDLACDLREPRFTAYLLVGWQPARSPGSFFDQPNYTIVPAPIPKHLMQAGAAGGV